MQITNVNSSNYVHTIPKNSAPSFGANVKLCGNAKDRYMNALSAFEPNFLKKKLFKAQNPIKVLMTKIKDIHQEQDIKIYETEGWGAFNYISGHGYVWCEGKLVAENLTTGRMLKAEKKDGLITLLEYIVENNQFWEKIGK